MLVMHYEIIVPEGVSGEWAVQEFEVSEAQANFSAIREALSRETAVPAGRYKRLMRGNVVVMSNTPMEVRTHRRFVSRARGSVLINGLGLGMALSEILKKPEVLSVTVIEKSPDVIGLVAPSFTGDPRVQIIHADAFEWKPPKGVRYDAVWHDIWDEITADNLPEMNRLHRKYGFRADWQDSWAREQCQERKRRCDAMVRRLG